MRRYFFDPASTFRGVAYLVYDRRRGHEEPIAATFDVDSAQRIVDALESKLTFDEVSADNERNP